MPLGILMVATMLKDHEVAVYDPNISDDPYGGLKKKLSEFRPDVVGISIRNIDNQQGVDFFYYYKTLRPTLAIIKETAPAARVMAGGAGFSIFAKTIMERVSEIDYGVYLEGEGAVPELLRNLDSPEKVKGIYYRKNGKVMFTGVRSLPDFERLPFARKDLVDLKKYSGKGGIGIQTKRGCAYRCTYCTYPYLNGSKLRMRTPENVVDEIEDLVRRGITHFMFSDALFTIPLSHAEAICREILRRKLKVEWFAWAEPKLITREFLELARDAGCVYIAYSTDALSSGTLKVLGKNFTEADVVKVYNLAKEVDGIKTGFCFFVGAPEETVAGLFKMVVFFIKGNIVLRLKRKGGIGLNWIRIEPETGVYNYAVSKGVIKKDADLLPEGDVKEADLFYVHPPLKSLSRVVKVLLVAMNSSLSLINKFRHAHG